MKKFLTMMLAALMLLGLAACGNKDDSLDKKKSEPEDKTQMEPANPGKADKKPANGLTYDFSSPEQDTENAPSYLYFVQTLPTEETSMTQLLTKPITESYYDTIAGEIKTYPLFSRSEVIQEAINQGLQIVDEDGNPIEDASMNNNDRLIYVQDEANVNEIAIAVYESMGYNYITYGSMQSIEDITKYDDELDLDTIPQMAEAICGMTVTKDDLKAMLDEIQKLKEELPEEAIYMAAVMDPESYNSIQVALLPYEGPDTVGITVSRYIETLNPEATPDANLETQDTNE